MQVARFDIDTQRECTCDDNLDNLAQERSVRSTCHGGCNVVPVQTQAGLQLAVMGDSGNVALLNRYFVPEPAK